MCSVRFELVRSGPKKHYWSVVRKTGPDQTGPRFEQKGSGNGWCYTAVPRQLGAGQLAKRPRSLVSGLERPGRGSNLLEDQWKFDLGVVELLGGLPLAKLSSNGCGLDDLDARVTDSVSRSHFSVHLLNGTIEGGVSILLVHVVVTGPGLVPQPDAVVLDGCWVLLEDLQEC
nr:hypothetical protein [Tanacetum cinerariifolium]